MQNRVDASRRHFFNEPLNFLPVLHIEVAEVAEVAGVKPMINEVSRLHP